MTEHAERVMPVLAIDLGGTQIRAALVAGNGRVMARECHLTRAEEGQQFVINRIFRAVDSLLNTSDSNLFRPESISIAAAGAIDAEKGVITVSPNLPGWCDVPLRDIVRERFGIDTFLLNDANAAALGEQRFGAGKGADNLIYVTVSTGIGGGIIINGELYSGVSGSAGEIGHMTIDASGPGCKCGSTGCLEALASGTAVAEEAIKRIGQGVKSSMVELAGMEVENITAREVGQAARDGDSLASEIIEDAATYLGIGLANLVNIFNPEVIVIGGGMAKMGDILLEPARQVALERAFSLPARAVRIVSALLGDDAGILGAAVFARQQKHIGRAG